MSDFIKYIDIPLSLDKLEQGKFNTEITIKSRDRSSIVFRINTRKVVLDELTYFMINDDETVKFTEKAKVDNFNRWEIPFDYSMIGGDKEFTIYLMAKQDNKERDLGAIIFNTSLSKIDEGLDYDIKVKYISEIDDFIKESKKKIDDFVTTVPVINEEIITMSSKIKDIKIDISKIKKNHDNFKTKTTEKLKELEDFDDTVEVKIDTKISDNNITINEKIKTADDKVNTIEENVNKNTEDILDLVDDVNSIIVPTKLGELENDRKYTPRDEVIELFNIIKPQGIEIVPQYQYGTNNVDDLNENFWWSDGKGENLWNTSYSSSEFSWDNEITSTGKYFANEIMLYNYIITVLKPSETYSAQMNYTVGKIQGEPINIWSFLLSLLYRTSVSGENPVETIASLWEPTPPEDLVEDKTYHRRGRFTTPSDLNFVSWFVYGLNYIHEDGVEEMVNVTLSKVKLEKGDIVSPYSIGKLDHEARKTDYLWTRHQIWHADGTYSYTKARRA